MQCSLFQTHFCLWSDGAQLLYRNYRENSELRSVPVEQFDYFIPTKEEESHYTPGMTLMEHYLRNESFGLKLRSSDQVTRFQQVNLNSLIDNDSGNTSKLCSFIAGHPLVLGQWFLIECDHVIQSDYVICEKQTNKFSTDKGAPTETAQHRITDRRISCEHAKQFFFGFGHRCYELLHTTWSSISKKCVKGDYNHIFLRYSAIRNVWSKWAYLLLTEFGIWSESNNLACVKKSCKNCVAQNVLSWRHSYSCNVNKRGLGHWLCETEPTNLTIQQQCISNQNAEWYECDDGTCILGHYQCDGIQHCISNSDEIGCSWQTRSPTVHHRYHRKMMWLQDTNDEQVPLYKWYAQKKSLFRCKYQRIFLKILTLWIMVVRLDGHDAHTEITYVFQMRTYVCLRGTSMAIHCIVMQARILRVAPLLHLKHYVQLCLDAKLLIVFHSIW